MHCRFFHRAKVNAAVEVVWNVLTEHEKFSEWTNIDWRITRPGTPERNGLGCVRLGVGEASGPAPWPVEEVVNYWVPYQLYGYHITSGVPVTSHQGIVRFWSKGPNLTEWLYDMQIRPEDSLLEQVPDVYAQILKGFSHFMSDIEGECERRASDIDVPAFPLPVTETGLK